MITPIVSPSKAISPINNLFNFDTSQNRQNNPFMTYSGIRKEGISPNDNNNSPLLGEASLSYKSLNFFA
jgi:hypothetical protein